MKAIRLSIIAVCVAALLSGGCASMSRTGRGALIGGGGGALVGAGIGALAGGGRGAAIGSVIGGAAGAATGAVIGNRMERQRQELAERLPEADVETVTDENGLTAIKVTFPGAILFETNRSDLNASARSSLSHFARSVIESPDTDLAIYGHTDNTGTRALNERLSAERAEVVRNYLLGQGVPLSRFVAVKGLAFDVPVADNSTTEGRAANRRVEIFVTANENMIRQAEAGNIQ